MKIKQILKILESEYSGIFGDFSEEGENRFALFRGDEMIKDGFYSLAEIISYVSDNISDKKDIEVWDKWIHDTVEIEF